MNAGITRNTKALAATNAIAHLVELRALVDKLSSGIGRGILLLRLTLRGRDSLSVVSADDERSLVPSRESSQSLSCSAWAECFEVDASFNSRSSSGEYAARELEPSRAMPGGVLGIYSPENRGGLVGPLD